MSAIYTKVPGEDIGELVNKIMEFCNGKKSVDISVACLIVATYAQCPTLSVERVQQIVTGGSEYLVNEIYGSPDNEVSYQ